VRFRADTEVVLVADDEPCVLSVVSSILRRAGFDVLPASSGQQALAIAAARREPIHLLLADVIMPDLHGPALADAVVGIHPETACLFMAGLPDTPEICERILRRGWPFLAKPFGPAALVGKVREALAVPATVRRGVAAV
jgi:DNA-binding NtrC family response regulator